MKQSSRCVLLIVGLAFVLLVLNLSAFADMSWSPVACTPTFVNVKAGDSVSFQALRGNGKYSWLANGANNTTGSDQVFTTSYKTPGGYAVVVASGDTTATCNLFVSPVAASDSSTHFRLPWWLWLIIVLLAIAILIAAISGATGYIDRRRSHLVEEDVERTRVRNRDEETRRRQELDTERRTRQGVEDTHWSETERILGRLDDHMTRQSEHMDRQESRWQAEDQRRADKEQWRRGARSIQVDGELQPDSAGVYRIINPHRQVVRMSFEEPHPIDLKIGEPQIRIVHDVPSAGQAVREERPVAAKPEPAAPVVETTTAEPAPTAPSQPAPEEAEVVPANAAHTFLGNDDQSATRRIHRTPDTTEEERHE